MLLETLDVAAEVVVVLVVDADLLSDDELDVGAAAAVVELELDEWLLEPHAATSSAGASAKAIRLRIGSG